MDWFLYARDLRHERVKLIIPCDSWHISTARKAGWDHYGSSWDNAEQCEKDLTSRFLPYTVKCNKCDTCNKKCKTINIIVWIEVLIQIFFDFFSNSFHPKNGSALIIGIYGVPCGYKRISITEKVRTLWSFSQKSDVTKKYLTTNSSTTLYPLSRVFWGFFFDNRIMVVCFIPKC